LPSSESALKPNFVSTALALEIATAAPARTDGVSQANIFL
tara:strand:+ start:91 stop:210 length:120 start_codon:yes stop_codon:yes gene_type:complete